MPGLLLAATPIRPPRDGKCWAFHLINDTPDRIERGVVESVDYEWGDMGNGEKPRAEFGPVAPGACCEIWREDDDAAELRFSITVTVVVNGRSRGLTGEFGKLYHKEKRLTPVPILGKPGVLAEIEAATAPEPRLRAWRAGQGYLVDRGPTKQGVVHPLPDEFPEGAWRDFHEFAHLDAQGNFRTEYYVSVWSIDDELGASTHAVIGDELREYTVRTFYGSRETEKSEKAVLQGLREIPASDEKTIDFLLDALSAHRQEQEEAAERYRKANEARIAAIPGAGGDLGAGENVRRAQEVLKERIQKYGDSLSESVLKVLCDMAARYPKERHPNLGVAMEYVALAGRRSAFDHTLKNEAVHKPGPTERKLDGVDDLIAALKALRAELKLAEEIQEEADANLNAAEFRKAGDHVERALNLLISAAR